MAQALAALALTMFVATGASHDLLHLDEPAPVHASKAGVHAPAPEARNSGHARLDLPAGGCSAHSASAHAAAPAPCASAVPPPPLAELAWRPMGGGMLDDLGPPTPHGPPRA